MASFTSILVIFAILVSRSYQERISDEAVKVARSDCQKETGAANELIEKAENGEFTDDKNLKCFTKCFYAKLGYVNDAGELQMDVIKDNIPESMLDKGLKVIEKCKDKKSADPCESAFELHKCYFEQILFD